MMALALLVLLGVACIPLAAGSDAAAAASTNTSTSAAGSHVGAGHLQHHTVLHRLPMCTSLLPRHRHLPRHHHSSHDSPTDRLRDLIQHEQQLERDRVDREVLLSRKGTPFKDIGEERAFSTNLTAEQLKEQAEGFAKELEVVRARIAAEQERLIAGGYLAVNADRAQLASCLMGRLNRHMYPSKPLVTFMLQYYNRSWMIPQIIDGVKDSLNCTSVELVVNVDEPSEHQAWAEYAVNSSGLVIPVFNNNVHEIRAYNRLSELASGEYLITHQDDEIVPANCSWLPQVLSLMEAYPRLGALGLKGFRYNVLPNTVNRGQHFRDPKTGLGFQFVGRVDFSPMLIRKSALQQVGGLDEGLSNAGECGIWSDWELSSRLWASGWQVGYHRLEGRRNDRSGRDSGTHKPDTMMLCWGRQQHLASTIYNLRWGNAFQTEINQLVKKLNHDLLQPTFAKCPFSSDDGGCELWGDNYPPAKIPAEKDSVPSDQFG